METAAQPLLLSVEDYLMFEAESQVRHEYIGGRIHAMAGASEQHNLIAGNIHAAFHGHLRGGPCRAYIADFKVRLEINREDLFYYPDVMVSCVRDGLEKYYLRHARLLVEVLSDSTEVIDRREKLINYPQISTLEEYVLVAQDKPEVTLLRRSEGWKPVVVSSLGGAVEFRSIQLSMPLAAIYERVF
ncbi:MAG: Uma2 family endonuclease [Opitutus sp.]|nr:Uma2 family endonuclease [Opitutus sp.]